MILDHIINLADDLGVPHFDVECGPNHTRACKILDRIECLLLIDHEPGTYLGERFRFAKNKVNQ
jgi:hypothetical protein